MFLQSERSGFYLRVLEEGELGPGDEVTLVRAHPGGLSVRDAHHLRNFDRGNIAGARRAAANDALAASWRREFEEIVQRSEREAR